VWSGVDPRQISTGPIAPMRYSKRALMIFGAGLVLGLVVVAAELPGLARVASVAMALGILLLPLALVADWRSAGPIAAIVARLCRGKSKKRRTAARRKPRARAPARRRR
jgi:hypothetical protein